MEDLSINVGEKEAENIKKLLLTKVDGIRWGVLDSGSSG
jgi:hypothetical protein